MNPNSPNQQPPAPGVSAYAGLQPVQQPPLPPYATDPRSLLAANGMPPVATQQVGAAPQPQPAPLPPPPPPGQASGTLTPGSTAAGPANTPQPVPGQPFDPGTKPAITNPNSTQNMLQIAEIRDGIVIMNDGSFRSVVMVNSINFDLMSKQEQEAIEYNYQNFLNSLYFPIQIFIRSQRVDLAPYIEKLDKIRSEHDNMLLALLMEDYISYMEQLSQQTNLMNKKLYIIVPFFPHIDIQKTFTQSKNFVSGFTALFGSKEQHVVINEDALEKAKTELRNRVQTVLDGLLQCNIQSLPLDTQELIELFYDTYNPDTATRQQLKNFGDMDVDIVSKGQGTAAQPHLDKELS